MVRKANALKRTNSLYIPGDSLYDRGMKLPKEVMKKIQWWLNARFGTHFKDLGDNLAHGKQEDFTDCGILCANTAACEIFEGKEIWRQDIKGQERAKWFLTLAKKHMKEVC